YFQNPLAIFFENVPLTFHSWSFGSWTTAQLAEDYRAVRQSTITLLRGLPAEAWNRKGTANNLSITARALAYGIAGHELHHMGIIRNRYLS
ncbi:DinB family protein, partial [Bacillus thuringiensis]|nr:DinB family protein [Bacillus thuringiensis]